jgi:hypothetical protein
LRKWQDNFNGEVGRTRSWRGSGCDPDICMEGLRNIANNCFTGRHHWRKRS